MIWPQTPERLAVGKLAVHQLRPAGVMVEMAGDQRNVDVAGFADRLAVVERFHHRKEAAVALDEACQRIEVAGAAMSRKCSPGRLRLGGGLDGGIDVGGTRLRDARQHLTGPGCGGLETFAGLRLLPGAADEQFCLAAQRLDPGARFLVAFGGRAVAHRVKNLCNRHFYSPLARRQAMAWWLKAA
jgi:hypothetical protein